MAIIENNTQTQRYTGTVKWFDKTKGYGFISADQGGADIFVHISAVENSRIGTLSEGQRISFELEKNNKLNRISAINLQDAS